MNKIVVTRSVLLGMFGVTLISRIHVPTRVLLAVEIILSFVQWLENLNIKFTLMCVNSEYHLINVIFILHSGYMYI